MVLVVGDWWVYMLCCVDGLFYIGVIMDVLCCWWEYNDGLCGVCYICVWWLVVLVMCVVVFGWVVVGWLEVWFKVLFCLCKEKLIQVVIGVLVVNLLGNCLIVFIFELENLE